MTIDFSHPLTKAKMTQYVVAEFRIVVTSVAILILLMPDGSMNGQRLRLDVGGPW